MFAAVLVGIAVFAAVLFAGIVLSRRVRWTGLSTVVAAVVGLQAGVVGALLLAQPWNAMTTALSVALLATGTVLGVTSLLGAFRVPESLGGDLVGEQP